MPIELIELMLDNSLVFYANLLGQQKLMKLTKWICGCFSGKLFAATKRLEIIHFQRKSVNRGDMKAATVHLKEIVHLKIEFLSSFTHTYVANSYLALQLQ